MRDLFSLRKGFTLVNQASVRLPHCAPRIEQRRCKHEDAIIGRSNLAGHVAINDVLRLADVGDVMLSTPGSCQMPAIPNIGRAAR